MTKHDNEESQSQSRKKWEDIENKHKHDQSAEPDSTETLLTDQEAESAAGSVQSAAKDRLERLSRQQLEDQLTDMEQQADEYKQKALRAAAEVENLRRRSEREVANAIKYGNDRLLSALLPVIDSLTRALDTAESDHPEIKSMREGIRLTLDLFINTLSRHGIQVIDPKPGDPFDPQFHEALSMQQKAGAKPNSILQVVQPGYQLNGRILRAAMVIVAAS